MIASRLFTWLQGADFYHDLHREAVETLPPGNGEIWMDVGCGPGLVTRLAAARGYRAIGIDVDPQMIRAAERISKRQVSSASFKVGDIINLPMEAAEVVSAASLLAVLDDKLSGLNMLWKCVRPGGILLIIEPTDMMTVENANKIIKNGLSHRRVNGLRLWAGARQGRTVDPKIYDSLGAEHLQYILLLHGLVGAWSIQKKEGGVSH
ncbi:MAG: class I SAM-dependent methyltransferase [Chloroflexota bacterium]